jgi:hypothetical protein
METISRKHPRNPRGAAAKRDLTAAYRSLFMESEAGRIVLADLAEFSQFNRVPEPTDSDAVVRYTHGRQSVFGRILNHLRLTETELERLQVAAREEGLRTDEYGVRL